MNQDKNRNLIFISISQFGMAMCSTFIMVFLPFLIFKISSYSSEETLLWIGLIMGSNHFVVMIASNFWGVLTSRFSPKLLYMRGLIAATIPLIISIFAEELKGGVIGFLNSSRFAGSAFGPMIATSILAISNLTILYLFISGLTLFALFGFKFFSKRTFYPQ